MKGRPEALNYKSDLTLAELIFEMFDLKKLHLKETRHLFDFVLVVFMGRTTNPLQLVRFWNNSKRFRSMVLPVEIQQYS